MAGMSIEKPLGQIIDELIEGFMGLPDKYEGWRFTVDPVNQELLRSLEHRHQEIRLRQWDFPSVFMQSITYAGALVFENYIPGGEKKFTEPTLYIPGRWEEEIGRAHRLYSLPGSHPVAQTRSP